MALEAVEFRLGAVETVLVTTATAPAVLSLRALDRRGIELDAVDRAAMDLSSFQGA